MEVDLSILRLSDQTFQQRDAHKFRGYVANKWKEFDLLHNHHPDGRSQYRYPLVQYKVLGGIPVIIGLGEGVQLLEKVFLELRELEIGGQIYKNLHKDLDNIKAEFGDTEQRIHYQFITPWMALNQENYQKFRRMGIELNQPVFVQDEEPLDILQSILVNNIIAVAKALGYTVRNILMPFVWMETCPVQFKNQPMLAFKGTFEINFQLPELIGLGKSSARGFGTIKRLTAGAE